MAVRDASVEKGYPAWLGAYLTLGLGCDCKDVGGAP